MTAGRNPRRSADVSAGVVVIHAPEGRGFSAGHEAATRAKIAEKLAALKGFDFAGDYDPSADYPGSIYFLPSDTIVGLQAARELGVRSEHDLFGGVVPHPFVATKAITHLLVGPEAYAPRGWSHEFGERVQDVVLAGFTAFTVEDARRAVDRLLEDGPARFKLVRANAGRGQEVISEPAAFEAVLPDIDRAELAVYGLTLEENLDEVVTYSVGQIRVADLVATYCGTQRTTEGHDGEEVYGGSDLTLARGDFDALLTLDLSEEARLAVAQARTYDAAATQCFPDLIASRRNYDVVLGRSSGGSRRSGVLEQSWRIGGASTAEIVALEAFDADPALEAVRASSVEVYGGSEDPPPDATVFFAGVDEDVGPIVKYATVGPL